VLVVIATIMPAAAAIIPVMIAVVISFMRWRCDDAACRKHDHCHHNPSLTAEPDPFHP